MPNTDEIQRIAAAMNALRPDWNIRSLVTYLERNHAARPFRDLIVAAVVVATDARTQTPKLLEQHGAWWVAAKAAQGTGAADPVHYARCPVIGHTSYAAHNCGACAKDDLDPTPTPQTRVGLEPARVRQILANHSTTDGRND